MDRILFSHASFEQLRNCPIEQLEEDISRTSIRLKLQNTPNTDQERERYKEELNKLSVFKYISQLRKGKLSFDDFRQKVELTT
ncbi:MAG TPA: hypothetical protein VIM77_01805 [Mucilaginibacter sp.]